jgi:hypothetical protein
MTTFLLIRHALCDPVGRSIAGRQPGIHLNNPGRGQARRLAEWLGPITLDAIYSSPLERALETASPIAQAKGLQVHPAEAWNEIDFGEWTGRALADLDPLPEWRRRCPAFPRGSRAGGAYGFVPPPGDQSGLGQHPGNHRSGFPPPAPQQHRRGFERRGPAGLAACRMPEFEVESGCISTTMKLRRWVPPTRTASESAANSPK